ncbi:endonuclease/exonuclease/phosphatase family protein [Cellulomonas alba]|uniref:Endonuclease/exonuclease/phosphatase family protein n=1 Tax=Cellulomonas alba TaxID=3053467 RepID=A0ABT7SHP6_9CELL|nr:endonuclease/exonuclease/phosphatase family protein [Cellulomonas alba]MDM7855714.1 endonuclease/exonuclease/phosphatase family protein [Cellulomonas alba]
MTSDDATEPPPSPRPSGALPAPFPPPAGRSAARPDPAALAVPPDAGVPTRVALLAVLTAACLELVRASGPLLDRWFTVGTVDAAVAAVVTFAGAGVVAGLLLLVTGRADGAPDGRTVLVGAVLLSVLRLVVQWLTPTPADGTEHLGLAFDVLGLATVTTALAVLTLVVAHVAATPGTVVSRRETAQTVTVLRALVPGGWPGGARQAALGLLLGCSLAVSVQMVLATWDAVWRTGWVGWEVTVVLVVVLMLAARGLVAGPAGPALPVGRPRRLWAVGPFVGLATIVAANPAFAASQSGVALGVAGFVLVGALTAGAWLLLRPDAWHGSVRVAAAVLLVGATVGAMWLDDWGALVALAVFDVAVGIVLTGALSSRRTAPPGIPRATGAVAVAGLGAGAPLLLYYLDYDVPLPVDNAWVVVAGAVVLALTGLRRRTPRGANGTGPSATAGSEPREPVPARVNAVRLLLLPPLVLALVGLAPSGTTTHGADVPARSASDELTLVDWNLHYEVSPFTAVDLEGIAARIEAEHPDVVTLQEVERGWVLGGGVDAATWLAHRLGMTVEFAPAADRQFGNAILARSALTDVAVHPLPYGAGPQHRSALSATLTTAGGTRVRVTSVHLQHRDTNTPTRLAEVRALLAAEPPRGPALLAGDLNATPGSPEVALLEGAGWRSAVDAVGDEGALTSTSTDPTERIDWVFGHGVTFVAAQVPTGPRQSDHLPVVVRLRTGG